jgi:transposase InsO family protein
VSIRRMIVEIDPSTVNVRQFCQAHGVSTWFFWDLRRRHSVLGDVVLEPLSRAPKRVANRIGAEVEEAVVAMRKSLDELGADSGPASIRYYLTDSLGEAAPSEATIWRVLRRRGFITPEPRKAPRHASHRFVASRANECWQIDATHWQLADDSVVEIINVLDDCSRVAVASLAVTTCTAENSFEAMCSGAQRWGWPEWVLSDNGWAFRGGGAQPGGLAAALAALGIASSHSRPYHPQTCGKVERFHQTMQKWLAAADPPADLVELQALLDAFDQFYNYRRPHRAIGRSTPASTWAATPRSGPATAALDAPTEIYTGRVYQSRLWVGDRYAIILGKAHNDSTATAVITGLAAHVFIGGRLIRELTLDPTHRSQPLRSRTVREAPRHQ